MLARMVCGVASGCSWCLRVSLGSLWAFWLAPVSASAAHWGIPNSGRNLQPQNQPSHNAQSGHVSHEQVQNLMRNRTALVVAGKQTLLATQVAQGLVEVGADVILAANCYHKCPAFCKRINGQIHRGKNRCVFWHLDLCDPASVWNLADGLEVQDVPIHVLVNCADDIYLKYHKFSCGWERTIGTNHFGPLLLNHLLIDRILKTMKTDAASLSKMQSLENSPHGARMSISSRLPLTAGALQPHPAPFGRILFVGNRARVPWSRDSILGISICRNNYTAFGARNAAMRANTLIALHLSQKLKNFHPGNDERYNLPPIEVTVVHPGRNRWLPERVRNLVGSLREPARMMLFAASCPLEGLSGVFLQGLSQIKSPITIAEGVKVSREGVLESAYDEAVRATAAPRMQWELDMASRESASRARPPPRAAVIR